MTLSDRDVRQSPALVDCRVALRGPEGNERIWDGAMSGDPTLTEAQSRRDRLADAARDGRWAEVNAIVTGHPELANSVRGGSASCYTPLHQVAYRGGDEQTARTLILEPCNRY